MSQLVPFCMPNDNRETGSFRRSVSLFPLSKGDNNEKGKRPLVVMGRRFFLHRVFTNRDRRYYPCNPDLSIP